MHLPSAFAWTFSFFISGNFKERHVSSFMIFVSGLWLFRTKCKLISMMFTYESERARIRRPERNYSEFSREVRA